MHTKFRNTTIKGCTCKIIDKSLQRLLGISDGDDVIDSSNNKY